MAATSTTADCGGPPIARVDIDYTDDRLACLSAHGEFDLATTEVLRIPLLRQLLSGRRAVALDMSAVTFVDVVAADTIVDVQRDFIAAGATLLITNPSHQVARVLALAGLERELLGPDRAAAFTG